MEKRTKVLGVGLVAMLVTAIVVGLVFAQDSEETTPSVALPQTFLGRVAANLGVEEDTLVEAIAQAQLQSIDEAVEQGSITEQQAERMKEQLEARQTMLQMIEDAVAEGELTQEQADLMLQRLGAFGLRGGCAIGLGCTPGGLSGSFDAMRFGGSFGPMKFGCQVRGRR
jgi:polyhydroxyalkanoate synthesis regulator phasin